jgi:dihydrofolate synthase/folylpolyglutamate synthase
MCADRSYQETIEYLFALQKHGVKLGLANTRLLMALSGNPHERFRSVHVSGTNGKGSTSAFVAAVLAEAGYRVGLYTSPHLVDFTERIRINGTTISEARVVELARRIREAYEREPEAATPTFFEVTTAIAFAYFAEEGVDFAVIEVGMGGRLDSTNVITPLVSVITNIDLEHTEFLGGTLELIAAEKAGIIKQGVPVVTGAKQPEARRVIEEAASGAGSALYLLGRDFSGSSALSGKEQQFDYSGIDTSLAGAAISLKGRYQIDNACLALAALECMRAAGVRIDEGALRRGLRQAYWEGRLEQVAARPDIYLDGAHNPASARELAGALRELKAAYRRVVLVIGVLADKDFRSIAAELVPLADRVIVTKPAYSRALDPETLAGEIGKLHTDVSTAGNVAQAIDRARERAGTDELILVTGSLYVVGDARAAILGSAGRSPALSILKG